MPRSHPVSLALVLLLAVSARADDGPPAVRSPVSPERRAWAEDLAKTLGLELRAAHVVKQPAREASEQVAARPGWSGLLLELDGLVIECRRCDDVSEADELFGRHVKTSPETRTVMELRGSDVVVLRGRVLDDPRLAARALTAAWAPREWTDARRAIGAMAPSDDGEPSAFAGFSFQPGGSFYEAGAGVLRAARANAHKVQERADAGIVWRFLDGDLRNHVLVTLPGGLVTEAELTPSTMLVSVGVGAAAQEAEEAYLLALLRAAEVTLPRPATGLIELIDSPSPPR